MSRNALAQFLNQKYINLETYKKSGQAVHTPVWFVQDNKVIYVRTDKNSGKVKRVRNNPHVRTMPCDFRGRPKGEWVDGTIQFISVLMKPQDGSSILGVFLPRKRRCCDVRKKVALKHFHK